MIIKPLAAGVTLELRHPLAGAEPLDLISKLRETPLKPQELALYREVVEKKAQLSAKAAAYSAAKLRDELEAAKTAIDEHGATTEAMEELARVTALASDPAVARAVETQVSAAIQPELGRLDSQLIFMADRLVGEVRKGLEAATSKLDFHSLGAWIEDIHLLQVASYCQDRVAASHALLDSWQVQARSMGAEALLRDKHQA